MLQRIFPALLLCLALVFALASCGKSKGGKSSLAAHPWKADVQLQDAQSEQGCLSLPKLFAGLRNVDPNLSAETEPTSIAFESAVAVRDDFRKVIAYGQLVIGRQPMAALPALPEVTQEGCSKVTVTGSDNSQKTFTVKSSARDSLVAEAEDGERLDYTWLSSRSFRYRHRYSVFDQPCGAADKPVLVTVSKVIDWSDAGIPQQVPATGSPFSIDSDFLSLAGAAVGADADAVYATGADGTRMIDLDKVNALTAKPPRPEVISCNGTAEPDPVTPTPTPTPDPPAVPDPTPNPNPNPNPDPVDPFNPEHPHPGGTPR